MKRSPLAVAVTTALFSVTAIAEVTPADLPAMIVSADFRPNTAQETPVSLTQIDNDVIESRGAQHLDDVLNLAPNVNVSSGAARGQYFQIRGIGERSQFSAPINPSVGLLIDGIDFSRTGGAATLFDIESVEILRGPQGTKFGTNALAGVINMKSTEPTNELDMHFETGIAEYNTRNVGIAVGGPLVKDTLLGRFSVYSHQSDGYMDNDYLGRDNVQNHDEVTARGHLKWLVNSDLTVDLNLLHINIDNGYDAFTLDNSRNSLSDMPGEDAQNTNAFALKTDYRVNSALQLQSNVTYVQSDLKYSYDADWSNVPTFNAFEEFNRDRENYSVELKALSNEDGWIFGDTTEWAVGIYFLSQDEELDLNSDFGNLDNDYETENTALFGQLDTHLTEKLTLITGLRVEYFDADYKDSSNLNIDTSERLFGGKLGLNYQLNDDHLAYTSLSRGYKSGGVNNNDALPENEREFDTEYMWSMETGLKSSWLDGDLITNIAAFYSIRRDAQVKSSVALLGGEFKDSIINAGRGKNYGLEADFDWLINDDLRLFGAVGLLRAVFDEYDNPNPDSINVEGRRQAHAPNYQFTLGTEIYLTSEWTVRANMEGKDDFYFSNSHSSKSGSYVIYNASATYQKENWKFTLWGRNLFDKDYYTRGFFFDNTPPNYEDNPTTYKQYGDPRVIGMTVSYDY
ncbi:TonB-dependent receptor [Methylophaga thiooxydans]|uniref:TonB-dependent receptor plug domain protein n=1 Tax=Methylophaga thiooxydans DMS010 TaxID=637616 RepID=C0N8B5_9GAMM|nr:TonB-dependent receptor [Methylophaga thiooxydans]EEF78914.1 TonB-dependent receptor plug domain protein [Methylophaga thiooxydans DMS010]